MTARIPLIPGTTGAHRAPGTGSLGAQKQFQRGFQFASGVFVAGLCGHRDCRPKYFFRVMLLPELLIKLSELIVCRDVSGTGISAGFERTRCLLIFTRR